MSAHNKWVTIVYFIQIPSPLKNNRLGRTGIYETAGHLRFLSGPHVCDLELDDWFDQLHLV